MEFSKMKEILADEAKKAGITEYDVYHMTSSSVSTETLRDEISSFSSETGIGICFRCVIDGRFGSASCERITEEELRGLVNRAAENAKYVESDAEAILYPGSKSYHEVKNPVLPEPSAAELKELALKMQKNTYLQDPAVCDGTQSYVGSETVSVDLFNSYGLSLHREYSIRSAVAVAVVNRDGESANNFESYYGADYDGAMDLSGKVVKDALAKLGAKSVAGGNYNVILDGKQMSVLLRTFSSAFSAKSVRLGLSLLAGKEGEKIASDVVTIVDDPFADALLGKTSFDAEGVATETKTVIENGVLKTFLYDLSNAKLMGKETTANASKGSVSAPVVIQPYYFGMQGGEMDFDALLATCGDGIYVTELKGLHAGANAVTGDFSIESAGFMIENGKLGAAVKNFTIAGNFFELLKKIDTLSNRVKVGVPGVSTAFGAPDVLIKDVSVAGK